MTKNHTFLSPVQLDVLETVKYWLENETASKQIFTLFGYAGSGKSTLAQYVAQQVDGHAVFLTYTGKAASVLRQKGCEGAQTIHSAMYQPFSSQTGQVNFVLKKKSDITRAKLVILDECSMVDDALLCHLRSYGVPILAMGDPAQLPPIKGVGFLAAVTPDALLTEVHRQADGNPILQLATTVRNGRHLTLGTYGASRVMTEYQLTEEDVLWADQIIVGSNRKRLDINTFVRVLRGYAGALPMSGERLVCLRNHNRLGISNGEIFTVLTQPVINGNEASFEILSEIEPYARIAVTISISQFISRKASKISGPNQKPEFDFGYALTCHKAQGSQWGKVLVIDDISCFKADAHRWLYTAITRAQHAVTIAM